MKKVCLYALAFALSLTLCLVFVSCGSTADNNDSGNTEEKGDLAYELSGDGSYYTVIGLGNYSGKNVKIPSTYKDKPVSAIGNRAFTGAKIDSVEIPGSVNTIGSGAFSGAQMKSAIMEEGVKTIESQAFVGCNSLLTLVIPNSVETVKNEAVSNCENLYSVTIGSGVKSIGENAFQNSYKLYEVYNLSTLNIVAGEKGNGYAGYYALNVHTSLGEESTRFLIGNFVFAQKGSKYYLVDYSGSDSYVVLPSECRGYYYDIWQYAFYGDTSFDSVSIPRGVSYIGKCAFAYCTKLESVSLPDGLEHIGMNVFSNCRALKSIRIPRAVNRIDEFAFSFCEGLEEIAFEDTSGWKMYKYADRHDSGQEMDVSVFSENVKEFVTQHPSNYWFNEY